MNSIMCVNKNSPGRICTCGRIHLEEYVRIEVERDSTILLIRPCTEKTVIVISAICNLLLGE